jgi:hypothetical protein
MPLNYRGPAMKRLVSTYAQRAIEETERYRATVDVPASYASTGEEVSHVVMIL